VVNGSAMPTRLYALKPDGPARIEISFEPPGRQVRVLFDGQEVAQVADEHGLSAEPTVELPDVGILRLALADPPRLDEPVRATVNGQPLHPPGTVADLARSATRVLYAIAALTAALSLVAIATGSIYLGLMKLGAVTLALAAVYAVCGFVGSRGSALALGVAMVLMAGEALYGAILAVGTEAGAPLWPVIIRIFLLVPLARSAIALRAASRSGPPA
jgi:hypothetical protein